MITPTPVTGHGQINGVYRRSWQLTATDDSDTSVTFAHGVTFKPTDDVNESMLVSFEFINPVGYVSQWRVVARTPTTITMAKQNSVGSGDPSPQLRLHIMRIQSLCD